MKKLLVFIMLMTFHSAYASDKIPLREQLETLIAKDAGYNDAIVTIPSNFHDLEALELVDYKYIPKSKKILITLKDSQGNIHMVKAKFDEAIMVPTPIHNIPKGSNIQESWVTTIKFPKSKDSKSIVDSKESLLGNTAKKTLIAGKFISTHDIVKLTLMTKGKSVRMVYAGNNINIETRGTTLEQGGINDFIKVRNIDSGKSILAKILDEDTVTVGAR